MMTENVQVEILGPDGRVRWEGTGVCTMAVFGGQGTITFHTHLPIEVCIGDKMRLSGADPIPKGIQ
jgi:hypothetical protein